ncbi:MAG: hypothetical protein K2J50_07500, partial [Treponemataceae bacterium]|nr:hypothetical protein [Treponemataceae bacterium]
MKKNEKLRWLMPVVALLALWGGVFLASCSGDDGDGGEPYVPPEETLSTHLVDLTNTGVTWNGDSSSVTNTV